MSERAAVNFDTFRLTFYGTKYFKDEDDREVPFGTELTWRVFRQLERHEIKDFTDVEEALKITLLIIGAFVVLLALCFGPLLPVWMFLNSLSLLAHLPMIRVTMPAPVNYLLLEYLPFTRLKLASLSDYLEKTFSFSDDRYDFDVIKLDEE